MPIGASLPLWGIELPTRSQMARVTEQLGRNVREGNEAEDGLLRTCGLGGICGEGKDGKQAVPRGSRVTVQVTGGPAELCPETRSDISRSRPDAYTANAYNSECSRTFVFRCGRRKRRAAVTPC